MFDFRTDLCWKESWVKEYFECILEINGGYIGYKPRNQFWALKKKEIRDWLLSKKLELGRTEKQL